jgi:hypothetical protein
VNNLIQMKGEAAALIAQLDQVIGTVRLLWLEASPNSKYKSHWMARLNQLLDQRLHLMALRDRITQDV